MTFSPLQISVTPQKGKKSSKVKSLLSHLPHNKKTKFTPSSSLFAQMLAQAHLSHPSSPTQSSQSTQVPSKTQTSRIKVQKPSIKVPILPVTQNQKTPKDQKLLTQHKLDIQNKRNQESPKIQNQLHEALMIRSDRKTLRDVQKIAQDNKLNLSEIKLSQYNPKTPTQKSKIIPTQQILSKAQQVKETSQVEQEIPQKTKKKAKKNQVQVKSNQIQQHQTQQQAPQDLIIQKVSQEQQPQQLIKETTLAGLLSQKGAEKSFTKEVLQEKIEETKSEKTQEPLMTEAKRETQFKIAQSKETITHFTQRLKEEIANYKPPFTRLSMELNPKELGKLEVTITKKGKELQININANNPHALQTFIQNQNEFRSTLASAGFDNIDLNFSQNQNQENREQNQRENQKGNRNSLEDLIDAPLASSMEIKMVQYA